MKKIKKLKLSSVVRDELKKNEMNHLVGGNGCACACYAPYYEASSTLYSYTQYVYGDTQCMCACQCIPNTPEQTSTFQSGHNTAVAA